MLWDGSLEVWDIGADELYHPRHGEYRGELALVGNILLASAVLGWTTPYRKYRTYNPFACDGELKGWLKEIRDFNNNVTALKWLADAGSLFSAPSAGVTHDLLWNAVADLVNFNGIVLLRTTAQDAAGQTISEAMPFSVNTAVPLPSTIVVPPGGLGNEKRRDL